MDVRPYEHRDVERQVVDPDADENSRGYADFKSRSARLLQSEESTDRMIYIIYKFIYLTDSINNASLVGYQLITDVSTYSFSLLRCTVSRLLYIVNTTQNAS